MMPVFAFKAYLRMFWTCLFKLRNSIIVKAACIYHLFQDSHGLYIWQEFQ